MTSGAGNIPSPSGGGLGGGEWLRWYRRNHSPSPRPSPAGRGRFLVALLLAFIFALPAFAADLPVLPKAKGEACVEDSAFMRRNHMDLLKHQRDATLRQGVRGAKHSLNACVACHATEGKAINAEGQFCQSCHTYAAVSVDCFDCHATTPGKVPGKVKEAMR